ncbi:metallophosphoesterase domain-containing protein [Rhizobium phaseoli]|uniref:metallophosphoesterase n=1 Tax=Rhizobium phaseoli TaxID=396 RepID=UPI0007EB7B6A|nr:metallophosphoesterase [Rhizobium phaseoli]ANL28604.1 metallophosphoesterase domain-containing protein [Rhizobium phaseoli]ANM04933.1 metallophosphoesterase domain-containing protein [Rhizobium phaseoli]
MTFVKKFYVSDTHLGHERLLSMQPRPFSSIEEHDEHIIKQWNSVVGDDDIVYHLGDFAFSLKQNADRVRELFGRLNGRKVLIIGNHDVTKKGDLHPTLASLDWAARPEHAMRTRDDGHDLWMSHYAARSWPSQHYGAVHFYGHSHGKLPGVGRSRDVGVDMPDVLFQPRTFAELTAGMEFPDTK